MTCRQIAGTASAIAAPLWKVHMHEEKPLCFLFKKASVLSLSSTKPFLIVPVGGEQGADGYSLNPVN